MAFASEPVRERFLATASLTRHTPQTITDPDEMRRALGTVPVAAIGIGAPVSRFRAMPRKRLARVVVEAGEAVSRRLGWSEDVMSLQKES